MQLNLHVPSREGEGGYLFFFFWLFALAELVSSTAFLHIILPALISVCLGYLSSGQDYFKAFVVAGFFEIICFIFWEKNKTNQESTEQETSKQLNLLLCKTLQERR